MVPVTVPSVVVSGQVWPLPTSGPTVVNLSSVFEQQLHPGIVVVVVAASVVVVTTSVVVVAASVVVVAAPVVVVAAPVVVVAAPVVVVAAPVVVVAAPVVVVAASVVVVVVTTSVVVVVPGGLVVVVVEHGADCGWQRSVILVWDCAAFARILQLPACEPRFFVFTLTPVESPHTELVPLALTLSFPIPPQWPAARILLFLRFFGVQLDSG